MIKTIPVSEARQTLPLLVTDVSKVMGRVIITRNGKPAAVLIGVEEYESLIQSVELLRSRDALAAIKEGLADLHEGRAESFEGVFGEPLHGGGQDR